MTAVDSVTLKSEVMGGDVLAVSEACRVVPTVVFGAVDSSSGVVVKSVASRRSNSGVMHCFKDSRLWCEVVLDHYRRDNGSVILMMS